MKERPDRQDIALAEFYFKDRWRRIVFTTSRGKLRPPHKIQLILSGPERVNPLAKQSQLGYPARPFSSVFELFDGETHFCLRIRGRFSNEELTRSGPISGSDREEDEKTSLAKPVSKKSPDKKAGKVRAQFAVLPWREAVGGGLEILLVTSRETRRWVIPKGWPMKGLAPNMAASREAYEEAGVEGYPSMTALGAYRYDKRLANGRLQPVDVEVYPLQVAEEHAEWPEMTEREKLWAPQGTAASLVDEPGLQVLINAFHPYGQPDALQGFTLAPI
jgi:8-oxo-dGTP pyrophosphatase MutT (NUDIX family)